MRESAQKREATGRAQICLLGASTIVAAVQSWEGALGPGSLLFSGGPEGASRQTAAPRGNAGGARPVERARKLKTNRKDRGERIGTGKRKKNNRRDLRRQQHEDICELERESGEAESDSRPFLFCELCREML